MIQYPEYQSIRLPCFKYAWHNLLGAIASRDESDWMDWLTNDPSALVYAWLHLPDSCELSSALGESGLTSNVLLGLCESAERWWKAHWFDHMSRLVLVDTDDEEQHLSLAFNLCHDLRASLKAKANEDTHLLTLLINWIEHFGVSSLADGSIMAAICKLDVETSYDEPVERDLQIWIDLQELSAKDSMRSELFIQILRKLSRGQQLEVEFERELQERKLKAMKELAYGASHEINNPLANISTRAQTLIRDESDPERRRKLETINAQAFRAHEMISNMMLFAKPPQLTYSKCDMVTLIENIINDVRQAASAQGTTLTLGDVPSIEIECDVTHLQTAICALIHNSLEALETDGTIGVGAAHIHDESDATREWIVISVIDDGPGILAEAREHLFDPFYSGREAGRGLGLGLSKCWSVVKQHQGEILVPQIDTGTEFQLRLPVARPATATDCEN